METTRKMLNLAEAAEYVLKTQGVRVRPDTIRRWFVNGAPRGRGGKRAYLEFKRVGGHRYTWPSAIDRFHEELNASESQAS